MANCQRGEKKKNAIWFGVYDGVAPFLGISIDELVFLDLKYLKSGPSRATAAPGHRMC